MSAFIGKGHKGPQTSSQTTATDAFKLISGIRRHIENDHCRCCKAALLNIISVENIGAGSTGDQAIEPAADGRVRTDTSLHGGDYLRNV
jgi:hypothetical protein